jgi:hypothetical protein
VIAPDVQKIGFAVEDLAEIAAPDPLLVLLDLNVQRHLRVRRQVHLDRDAICRPQPERDPCAQTSLPETLKLSFA